MHPNVTLLVTGGSGYVASVLMEKFLAIPSSLDLAQSKPLYLQNISKIILIDKCEPLVDVDDYNIVVQTHQVDILDCGKLNDIFRGVDVVFHLASYGMSGREQLNTDVIWDVNVQGTINVIEACQLNNVKSLIFTSTVNVVYGGQRIEGGDETLPYFNSIERVWDNYGNSKTRAEKYVLQANGTSTKNGKSALRTCTLRLPGIYGPKERRHIPRVVKVMKQGLFKVTYGKDPVVEFIHVENVVQALILSHRALQQPESKSAGEAYFVSDGKPINNFEFFRPLTEALNITYPKISVPFWIVYYIAYIIEIVYWLVHRYYDFQPLLCRAEVYKTGQTHYFSIAKARKDLGYHPQYQNDTSAIADEYRVSDNQQCEAYKAASVRTNVTSVIVNLCLVIIAFSLFMSFLPTVS